MQRRFFRGLNSAKMRTIELSRILMTNGNYYERFNSLKKTQAY